MPFAINNNLVFTAAGFAVPFTAGGSAEFAGVDAFSTHAPAAIEQEFQGVLKGLNSRVAHRSDGGAPVAVDANSFASADGQADWKSFHSDINTFSLYLRGCWMEPNVHITAAERIAARLKNLAERDDEKFQSNLDELFNTPEKFGNLYLIVRHMNLMTGSRIRVKRGESFSIEVSIRPDKPTPNLQTAYGKLKEALFEPFKGTTLLCKVMEEIERYADSFAGQPYVWKARHEANRALFYAGVFAEIVKIYQIAGAHTLYSPQQAETIFQRFVELGKEKRVVLAQIRHAWRFGAELFRKQLSAGASYEMLKNYYGYSDEEFQLLMDHIPKRYLEVTYPFLIDKMDLLRVPANFKRVVDDLAQSYRAADNGFRKAVALLKVDKTPEFVDGFVAKAAATAQYPGTGSRNKYEMMEMVAWRYVIPVADLKACDWQTLKKALAGAYGITNREIDKLFAEIKDEEYRIHIIRHVLKNLHLIEDYTNRAQMKYSVIDHKVKRLRNAVERTKKALSMFPGGDGVSEEEITRVAAGILIKLGEIVYDDREAVRAIKKLKGEEFLLSGFSAEAADVIRKFGIEDYFGWFYPQVYGLPQALVEANVNYLGISGELAYFARSDIHRGRAERFKDLLAVADERLTQVQMGEKEAARIRQEAVEWLAHEALGIRRFYDKSAARQLDEWLDIRISEGSVSWADAGWASVAVIMGKVYTASARIKFIKLTPKTLRQAEINQFITDHLAAYMESGALTLTANGMESRFFGRLDFYLNELKEIGEAAVLLELGAADDAVSFAKDVLTEIEKVTAGRQSPNTPATRRLIWFLLAKRHIAHPSIEVKKRILEKFYGIEDIGSFISEDRLNSSAFGELLSYWLNKLRNFDTAADFKRGLRAWNNKMEGLDGTEPKNFNHEPYGYMNVELVLSHDMTGAEGENPLLSRAAWLDAAAEEADNILPNIKDGFLAARDMFVKAAKSESRRDELTGQAISIMTANLVRTIQLPIIRTEKDAGKVIICARRKNGKVNGDTASGHFRAFMFPYERREGVLVPSISAEKALNDAIRPSLFKNEIALIAAVLENSRAEVAIAKAIEEGEKADHSELSGERIETSRKAVIYKFIAVARLYPHRRDARFLADMLERIAQDMEKTLSRLDFNVPNERARIFDCINIAACDANIAVSSFLKNRAAIEALLVRKAVELMITSTYGAKRKLLRNIVTGVNMGVASKLLKGETLAEDVIKWFDTVKTLVGRLEEMTLPELQIIIDSYPPVTSPSTP